MRSALGGLANAGRPWSPNMAIQSTPAALYTFPYDPMHVHALAQATAPSMHQGPIACHLGLRTYESNKTPFQQAVKTLDINTN